MILPLLAGAGILWLLFSKPSTPTTPPGPPPKTDAEILRDHVAVLLSAATVAPQLVDPKAMDAAADDLDAAGLHDEAASVRAKAAEVRRAQTPIPPPVVTPPVTPPPATPTPAPAAEESVTLPSGLPEDIATVAKATLANPEATPIASFVLLDEIERRFRPGSFPDLVERLRATARQVKSSSPPASIANATALLELARSDPSRVSPSFLEAVASDVAASGPLLSRVMMQRAAEMRANGEGLKITRRAG
jgi:hypothetical protein